MRYWDSGHMDGGWAVVMIFGMLGIWALVAVAIIWIFRATGVPAVPQGISVKPGLGASAAGTATRQAEQILAERLARGDIDVEEYRTRREALSTDGPS